jgi:hypothetical protein
VIVSVGTSRPVRDRSFANMADWGAAPVKPTPQTGTTGQTQRDRDELKRRRSWCPQDAFERMRMALRGQSKLRLVNEGLIRSKQTQCPRPDRLCRRQREALICWFCEFWPSRAGPVVALDTLYIGWTTCESVDEEWFGTYEEH